MIREGLLGALAVGYSAAVGAQEPPSPAVLDAVEAVNRIHGAVAARAKLGACGAQRQYHSEILPSHSSQCGMLQLPDGYDQQVAAAYGERDRMLAQAKDDQRALAIYRESKRLLTALDAKHAALRELGGVDIPERYELSDTTRQCLEEFHASGAPTEVSDLDAYATQCTEGGKPLLSVLWDAMGFADGKTRSVAKQALHDFVNDVYEPMHKWTGRVSIDLGQRVRECIPQAMQQVKDALELKPRYVETKEFGRIALYSALPKVIDWTKTICGDAIAIVRKATGRSTQSYAQLEQQRNDTASVREWYQGIVDGTSGFEGRTGEDREKLTAILAAIQRQEAINKDNRVSSINPLEIKTQNESWGIDYAKRAETHATQHAAKGSDQRRRLAGSLGGQTSSEPPSSLPFTSLEGNVIALTDGTQIQLPNWMPAVVGYHIVQNTPYQKWNTTQVGGKSTYVLTDSVAHDSVFLTLASGAKPATLGGEALWDGDVVVKTWKALGINDRCSFEQQLLIIDAWTDRVDPDLEQICS